MTKRVTEWQGGDYSKPDKACDGETRPAVLGWRGLRVGGQPTEVSGVMIRRLNMRWNHASRVARKV